MFMSIASACLASAVLFGVGGTELKFYLQAGKDGKGGGNFLNLIFVLPFVNHNFWIWHK